MASSSLPLTFSFSSDQYYAPNEWLWAKLKSTLAADLSSAELSRRA